MTEPLISVVLPAYNERDTVVRALKSLHNQTYERLETIVVANACDDDTAKVARDFATRVIETSTQGISHAKNIGYSESNGSVCSFMDADSLAEEHLLEEVYKSIVQGYDGGKAKIRPFDDDRLRAKVFCWYSEAMSRITKYISVTDSGAGAFTFLTKKLGQKIQNPNGSIYREDLMVMEDVNLLTRMKKASKYQFITNSFLQTSMRRFVEEGYIKCLIEDAMHVINPHGKTRQRWLKK
jgi:glycosyltransferase involved in cell wall biosynthesis